MLAPKFVVRIGVVTRAFRADSDLERVRALGGEIIHPGERWVICRDSEGTPFGLAGTP
jgi:hypothetical protein